MCTIPSSPLLIVVGSGPGIGVSTACLFAQRRYARVALFSRDSTRLQEDRQRVLRAAKQRGKQVEVKTWSVDIEDRRSLERTLKETESFGKVECVFFNAAWVRESEFLSFPVEEIERDFRVRAAQRLLAPWSGRRLLKSYCRRQT